MVSISPVKNVSFKAALNIENALRNSEFFIDSEFAKNEETITDSFVKETSDFSSYELILTKDSKGFAEFFLKKDKNVVDIKTIPFFKYPQYQNVNGLLKIFHRMRLNEEFKQAQKEIKEKYKKEMDTIEDKFRLEMTLLDL